MKLLRLWVWWVTNYKFWSCLMVAKIMRLAFTHFFWWGYLSFVHTDKSFIILARKALLLRCRLKNTNTLVCVASFCVCFEVASFLKFLWFPSCVIFVSVCVACFEVASLLLQFASLKRKCLHKAKTEKGGISRLNLGQIRNLCLFKSSVTSKLRHFCFSLRR